MAESSVDSRCPRRPPRGRPLSGPAHRRAARTTLVTTVVLAGVALAACTDGPVGAPPEGAIDVAAPWRTVSPATVGLDAAELFVAGELGGRIGRLRSLVVVRSGRLAYERYYGGATPDSLADVRSVTKSIVSTLVGIAIRQGHLDGPDQSIASILGGGSYPLREEHDEVTVGHLLTMTGGFAWNEVGDEYGNWWRAEDHVAYLLARQLSDAPGSDFTYNTAATHLLGVVLAEATGEPVERYADRVLFGPLGIRARRWEMLSSGVVNGGAGVDLRPRDLARLGQLFLQAGWSGSRPVVPQPWVEEAVTPRFDAFTRVGPIDALSYGYLWWLDLEQGAFFAWGYAGQFVYVVPRLDLVVVATTDWRGVSEDIGNERLQEEVLRLIVDRIVPAAS